MNSTDRHLNNLRAAMEHHSNTAGPVARFRYWIARAAATRIAATVGSRAATEIMDLRSNARAFTGEIGGSR